MNGRGWECDYCGKREITELIPQYSYSYTHIQDAPPIGWFVIAGPSKGPMTYENGYLSVKRFEFCSWKCIENYAYTEDQNTTVYVCEDPETKWIRDESTN